MFVCFCAFKLTPVCFGLTGSREGKIGSKALELAQMQRCLFRESTVINNQTLYLCLTTLAFGLPFAWLADNERRPGWLRSLDHVLVSG